ncbi:hypothetical protein JAK24_17810 [Stenotrophomonas maltophilia]|nr:hypothetical protein [Stenotrophomonas maltophilia]
MDARPRQPVAPAACHLVAGAGRVRRVRETGLHLETQLQVRQQSQQLLIQHKTRPCGLSKEADTHVDRSPLLQQFPDHIGACPQEIDQRRPGIHQPAVLAPLQYEHHAGLRMPADQAAVAIPVSGSDVSGKRRFQIQPGGNPGAGLCWVLHAQRDPVVVAVHIGSIRTEWPSCRTRRRSDLEGAILPIPLP